MELTRKELIIIHECLESHAETLIEEIRSAEDDLENPYDHETKMMIRKYLTNKRTRLADTYKILVKIFSSF